LLLQLTTPTTAARPPNKENSVFFIVKLSG